MSKYHYGAYLFWYKTSQFNPTKYIYIVAVSEKQARFFYYKAGYTLMHEYECSSINFIPACDFTKRHAVGAIVKNDIDL